MKTSLLLAAAFVLSSVSAIAEVSSRPTGSPSGELSLLYKNTDVGPGDPATNLNIRPDFKLVNNTNVPIAYSRIKVRYWFTQEAQYGDGLHVLYTYASMGEQNLFLSSPLVSEPRENASRYIEWGLHQKREISEPTQRLLAGSERWCGTRTHINSTNRMIIVIFHLAPREFPIAR